MCVVVSLNCANMSSWNKVFKSLVFIFVQVSAQEKETMKSVPFSSNVVFTFASNHTGCEGVYVLCV